MRFRISLSVFVITAIAAMLLSAESWGQTTEAVERIRSFHSDITVNKDTTMKVTETIDVTSTGDQIKHGIYRDFPNLYGTFLRPKRVRFKVLDVQRDGKPEPYFTEGQQNGTRVYFGDKNTLLPPGDYSYKLTYETDHQLGYFKDHDELYWNVTGNGWLFPISRASATVVLPADVPNASIKTEGYTGLEGAKGKAYTSKVDPAGRALFATTSALEASEGLTIVVSWEKGHVTPPTRKQEMAAMLKDDRGMEYGLIGLLLLLIYYIFAWSLVGKDPPKGSIVPQYEPPDGLSPAAVRFVKKMGFDQKCIAADLIDMAVKGFITIDDSDGTYTLHKGKAAESVLSEDERQIADGLLGSSDSIELVNTNHTRIGAAYSAVGKLLKNSYQKKYFNTNALFMIPGIVITIATLAAGVLFTASDKSGAAGFITVWLSIWTLAVAALVSGVIAQWRAARYAGGTLKKVGNSMSAGCMTLFALPFIAGEIFGLVVLAYSTSCIFMATLVIAMVANFIFRKAIMAPTREGRALLDKIDGFREYMAVAETDSMSMFKGPAITPELFERFLPYALALDVEQAWSSKFSAALEAAGQTPDSGYHPGWYTGSNTSGFGTVGFASALGGSLSGAISSSSTAPGSSSGSGGGGSSGGGGGGGGGGGW